MTAQPPPPRPALSAAFSPAAPPLAGALDSLYAVRETCPAGAEYRHEALPALALFLTESGGATAVAGGRAVRHRPGGLVAVRGGLPLTERVDAGVPWDVGYLMMTGPWAEALGRALDERGRGMAAYHPAPAAWQRQLRELLGLCLGGGEGWQWPFLSTCATLFGALSSRPEAGGGAGNLLYEVGRLLDAQPGRAWSQDELAAELGLSRRQFGYRFGRAAGCPPAAWLRQRRIEAARRLLAEGRSVSETADALGFANPYHFSRVFRSVAGVPPSSVRGAARPGRLHG